MIENHSAATKPGRNWHAGLCPLLPIRRANGLSSNTRPSSHLDWVTRRRENPRGAVLITSSGPPLRVATTGSRRPSPRLGPSQTPPTSTDYKNVSSSLVRRGISDRSGQRDVRRALSSSPHMIFCSLSEAWTASAAAGSRCASSTRRPEPHDSRPAPPRTSRAPGRACPAPSRARRPSTSPTSRVPPARGPNLAGGKTAVPV
jgi:hypothetical protein